MNGLPRSPLLSGVLCCGKLMPSADMFDFVTMGSFDLIWCLRMVNRSNVISANCCFRENVHVA